jgi:thiol:disulfide interchange protein
LIAATCVLSFVYLGQRPSIVPWKDFSPAALAEAQAEGKTVMIDFTARWCLTCQMNYNLALDTEATLQVVDRNKVVPMIADWSDNDPTVSAKLKELKVNGIPALAIYPADGGKPIVLQAVVSQSQVIEALEAAGPSQAKPTEQVTLAERRAVID